MSAASRGADCGATIEGGLVYCLMAYHFPPDTSAGAVRARGLAKALADAGNEVHVFTRASGPSDPEGYSVHVVPGQQVGDGVKRAVGVTPGTSLRSGLRGRPSRAVAWLLHFGREWLLYPDDARAWARRCAMAVIAWGVTGRPDVVVSTAPPWSVHVAAWRVRQHSVGKIWVADWRDLWTANPHYDFGRFRRRRDARLERRLLDDADAVTVTTRDMGIMLAKAYPDVHVVPVYNGYDERRFAHNRDRSGDNTRLTITYAGYLYEGKRSVVPLLKTVSELIADGRIDRTRMCLQFAGPPDAKLVATVEELGLDDVVRLRGVVPRLEIPKLLEDSDVLLVIMWDSVLEASLVPAKTFEYIEADRPILALRCAPSSELGRLLSYTRTGVCVEHDDDIATVVLDLYRRFVSVGSVRVEPDLETLRRFTHSHMAAEFDRISRLLLEGTGTGRLDS